MCCTLHTLFGIHFVYGKDCRLECTMKTIHIHCQSIVDSRSRFLCSVHTVVVYTVQCRTRGAGANECPAQKLIAALLIIRTLSTRVAPSASARWTSPVLPHVWPLQPKGRSIDRPEVQGYDSLEEIRVTGAGPLTTHYSVVSSLVPCAKCCM